MDHGLVGKHVIVYWLNFPDGRDKPGVRTFMGSGYVHAISATTGASANTFNLVIEVTTVAQSPDYPHIKYNRGDLWPVMIYEEDGYAHGRVVTIAPESSCPA